MTIHSVSVTRLSAALRILAASAVLTLSAGASHAQSLGASDGLRYVPLGNSGRYEIGRDRTGYRAGTARPVAGTGTATMAQTARRTAQRAGVIALAGLTSKLIVAGTVVGGSALLAYHLLHDD